MGFPAPGVSPPSLQPWQFSFNGYVFGPGCALELLKIEGIDMPAVRSGDAGRPRDHGRFIGLDLMDGRDITITGELDTLPAGAWAACANATVPGGTTEYPLYFATPTWGTLVTMVRARKRSMPQDIKAVLGKLADMTLMFTGSDPRWYATPTLSPSVGLPTPNAGFGFPMTFPLQFGGGGTVGTLQVTNAGNIETRPLLVVNGPVTTPTIANSSISGSPYLAFGVTMNAGDQLVIDTDMHTATYYAAGSSVGAPRMATLQPGSSWWTLQPGVNNLSFSSKDQAHVAGTLAVQYASAYII